MTDEQIDTMEAGPEMDAAVNAICRLTVPNDDGTPMQLCPSRNEWHADMLLGSAPAFRGKGGFVIGGRNLDGTMTVEFDERFTGQVHTESAPNWAVAMCRMILRHGK